MPQADLIGSQHRSLQVVPKGVDTPDAAKAGTGDQDAVGGCRAGRPDLLIERFDFLFKALALQVEIAGRNIAPFLPRIVALVCIVAKADRDQIVAKPERQNQEGRLDLGHLKRRQAIEAVGRYSGSLATMVWSQPLQPAKLLEL